MGGRREVLDMGCCTWVGNGGISCMAFGFFAFCVLVWSVWLGGIGVGCCVYGMIHTQ